MARKRKTDQSKLGKARDLLQEIEQKTAHTVKRRLGHNWRDNLFEIVMTRIELAAPHKKVFTAIPAALLETPGEIPVFGGLFFKTMRNILKLAKAPSAPPYVAAFSIAYMSVIDTFLKDPTKDHSKTMAALDKRLGMFEQFVNFVPCPKPAA